MIHNQRQSRLVRLRRRAGSVLIAVAAGSLFMALAWVAVTRR